MTPMVAAAKRGFTEVVHLLLQAGGDPNSKNKVSTSTYKLYVLMIDLYLNNSNLEITMN